MLFKNHCGLERIPPISHAQGHILTQLLCPFISSSQRKHQLYKSGHSSVRVKDLTKFFCNTGRGSRIMDWQKKTTSNITVQSVQSVSFLLISLHDSFPNNPRRALTALRTTPKWHQRGLSSGQAFWDSPFPFTLSIMVLWIII